VFFDVLEDSVTNILDDRLTRYIEKRARKSTSPVVLFSPKILGLYLEGDHKLYHSQIQLHQKMCLLSIALIAPELKYFLDSLQNTANSFQEISYHWAAEKSHHNETLQVSKLHFVFLGPFHLWPRTYRPRHPQE